MSLPPVNPDKSASGISVDPRTLERVVASSRRKDGSTRKELKIRPGFTPQEDVGLFRSRAQRTGSASPSPALVPGSTRPRPQPTQAENPFAAQSSSKTKAQLKNEKRREKKRTESNKAWDESSDDDADGDMRAAFDDAKLKPQPKASEEVYPPAGPGAPEPGVAQEVKAPEDDERVGGTAILEKNPGTEGPETAAQMPGAPAPKPSLLDGSGAGGAGPQGTSDAAGPLAEAKQQQAQKAKAKPHPIQGGRQGPIGLAFPPPVEEPKAKEPRPQPQPQPQSRADQADSWRTVSGRGGKDKQAQGQGRGSGQRGNGPTNNGQARPNNEKRSSNRTQQPGRAVEANAEKKPEQRVRKEVRVKQGGANDVTSLASRVKNLVLDSTTGRATGGAGAKAGGVRKDVPVDGAKTPA